MSEREYLYYDSTNYLYLKSSNFQKQESWLLMMLVVNNMVRDSFMTF